MEGHVYTIYKISMVHGLLEYLHHHGTSTVDECATASSETLKSGGAVKHPRHRVSELAHFAADLGLVNRQGQTLYLTPLGTRYVGLRHDKWRVSPEQAELLTESMVSSPRANRTVYAIAALLTALGRRQQATLDELEYEFVDAVEKADEWRDVTRSEKTKFVLNYLEELGLVEARGRSTR